MKRAFFLLIIHATPTFLFPMEAVEKKTSDSSRPQTFSSPSFEKLQQKAAAEQFLELALNNVVLTKYLVSKGSLSHENY